MAKYYGNINEVFDSKEFLMSLESGQYEKCFLYREDGSVQPEFLDGPLKENVLRWSQAGYPDPICDGTIHCPKFHFHEKYLYAINNYLGIIADRCAVSVTKPGQVIAPHTDVDGRESVLEEYGTIVGGHIHLGDPVLGHVFMIEDKAYYMEKCGNVYVWDNWNSLHSGSNAGLQTRYLIAFRGIRPHKPMHYEYIWDEENPEYLRFRVNGERIIP